VLLSTALLIGPGAHLRVSPTCASLRHVSRRLGGARGTSAEAGARVRAAKCMGSSLDTGVCCSCVLPWLAVCPGRRGRAQERGSGPATGPRGATMWSGIGPTHSATGRRVRWAAHLTPSRDPTRGVPGSRLLETAYRTAGTAERARGGEAHDARPDDGDHCAQHSSSSCAALLSPR
jgi:hypothetical protein